MKQTAVEWFQDQIIKIVNGTCELSEIQIYEQAKTMEKEQMKKSYNHSRPNLLCYEKGTAFKEYYNETFKSE